MKSIEMEGRTMMEVVRLYHMITTRADWEHVKESTRELNGVLPFQATIKKHKATDEMILLGADWCCRVRGLFAVKNKNFSPVMDLCYFDLRGSSEERLVEDLVIARMMLP